jgi:hypothetical protein
MPRQPRLDVPGALHHIMVRGNNKANRILVTLVHRMLLAKRKLIDVVAPVALRTLK